MGFAPVAPVRPVSCDSIADSLLDRCLELGIKVEVVRGKVSAIPRPPEDLLINMKEHRSSIIKKLCPSFLDDFEFDSFVFKTLADACLIYPDLGGQLEPFLFGVTESLGLALADAVWKKEGR